MDKGNVPALRFSEFSGDWVSIPLGKAFPQIRNGFVGTATPFYKEDGIPYLQGKNIKVGKIKTTGLVKITQEFHERQKKSQLKANDILMVQSGHVGECAVVGKDFDGSNCHALVVMSPNDKVEPKFFVYYFYTPSGLKSIYTIKTGNTITHILTSDLKILSVIIPTLPEQQKIVAFLGAVEKKIGQLERKKSLLERYKKSCMQKLFPSTSGQTPELRFKDKQGNDYPDWQEKRLGDFCESLSGNPVSGYDIQEKDTGLPLLRGINITEGKIRHSSDIDRYHGGNINSGEKYILQTGDIVIGMDGSKVGKNIATIKKNDSGSFLIQRVTRLRKNSDNSLQYIYFHIISDRFRRYVDKVNTSSGIPHISLKQINDFSIPMPHPDEQQKIANFLSSLDNKIDLNSHALEKLRNFKKGLLQQMFV